MGSANLTNILPIVKPDENILVPLGDDAGVYKISSDLAIVQTVDFITPVVDDPFSYGAIAAANSLSDIFTMNSEAKTALSLVMHDSKNVPVDALKEILRGGQSKVEEAGAVIVGGHTIDDVEMKYGLSVTGTARPDEIWRNSAAKVGDKLILTKPLGMGILTTAAKNGAQIDMKEAVAFMSRLNLYAMRSAQKFSVTACTDITGFGLFGHILEMTGCDKTFEIDFEAIPFIKSALDLIARGFVPAGSKANMRSAADSVEFQKPLSDEEKMVLFDAQTSGGLLLAVDKEHAKNALEAIKKSGDEHAQIVGTVRDRVEKSIVVG